VKRKFADLDPETVRRAVPPKKRAVAETLGKSGAQDERRCVRFVRFVSDPHYVTANVVPVTLCDSPGVRCG
jgi:hypothetical protein